MSQTLRLLVTAGNTREKIDDVRDWGNIFTGNTGFNIVRALAAVGHVELLTSNRDHARQIETGLGTRHPVEAAVFTSHTDLTALLDARLKAHRYDAVFMTAAVADYRPAGAFGIIHRTRNADGSETWTVRDVQAGKVKSTHDRVAFVGEPTPKIIDMFRTRWGHRGLLVKFKLEVGIDAAELIRVGQASRAASGADYLVANTLVMVSGEGAGAFLLSERGEQWIRRDELAQRLAEIVRHACGRDGSAM